MHRGGRSAIIDNRDERLRGAGPHLVVLAAFFWGISGGIGALLIAQGWNPTTVSLYRGAIGLLFVLAWLARSPRDSGLYDHRVWLGSIIAGLGIAGNFTFYFISISRGSVAVAATLMYCAPVFVYLVSFLLKLEKLRVSKLLAVALVMFGIVLLTRVYDIDADVVTPLGIAAGLLSAVCYSIFLFGFKYATPHASPQSILTIAFAVFVVVLALAADPGQAAAVLGSPDWVMFAALGVLGAGLSFVLYVVGLNGTAPAIAAMVAMVEPVTATLFGFVVLDERLVGLQIIGMAVVLITVTALGVSSTRAGGSGGDHRNRGGSG